MTEVSLTRTEMVPLAITCPAWCSTKPEQHAEDLWNYDGTCIHLSADAIVPDPVGWSAYGRPTNYNTPSRVFISTVTQPNGAETEDPVLYVNDRDFTMQQALDLADEIRRQVELYRSTGGKA